MENFLSGLVFGYLEIKVNLEAYFHFKVWNSNNCFPFANSSIFASSEIYWFNTYTPNNSDETVSLLFAEMKHQRTFFEQLCADETKNWRNRIFLWKFGKAWSDIRKSIQIKYLFNLNWTNFVDYWLEVAIFHIRG